MTQTYHIRQSSKQISYSTKIVMAKLNYHASVYTDPWIDWGMINSSSNSEGPHISSLVGESSSEFRTMRSFEPEGEGSIRDAPGTSIGKDDHWKSTGLSLLPCIEADKINFLFLLASILGWLAETIALDPFAVQICVVWIQNKHESTLHRADHI